MSNVKHFLDNPEIDTYIREKMHILINESDRGAVLLSMSQIDNELKKLLNKIASIDTINKKKKQIKHMTISYKLNNAYTNNLIPKNLFKSIKKLNKIRNDVAHNIELFELENHTSTLKEIFELLGEGMSTHIHNFALNYMLESTIFTLLKIKEPSNQEEFAFKNHSEALAYLQLNPNRLKEIEKPLLKVKLTIGVLFISALIIHHRKQFLKVIGDNKIVSDIKT